MVSMNRVLWWWVLLALLLGIISQVAYASPVGCEKYNSSVIKCWNQGSIENETYFSEDLSQMANRPDRFGWANYSYRVAAVRDGHQYYLDLDCDGRPSYDSDNLSYWRLWCVDVLTAGPYALGFNISFWQGVDDDFVHRDSEFLTISGFDSFTGEIYLYTLHDDIDIDLDGDVDVVNFVDADGLKAFWLNGSNADYDDVVGGSLLLGDMDSASAIRWRWNPGVLHGVAVRQGVHNNRVYLYKMWNVTTPIGNGVRRAVRHEWIDAEECSLSIPGACGGSPAFRYLLRCVPGYSTTDCYAGNNGSTGFQGKLECGTLFGWAAVTGGSGCFYQSNYNVTSTDLEEVPFKTSSDDRLVCDSFSSADCKQDEMSGATAGWSRLWMHTCRKEQDFAIQANHTYLNQFSTAYTNVITIHCHDDNASPMVNLSEQLNGTVFDEGDDTFFVCNASDNYPIRNITFWSNLSGSWAADDVTKTGYFPSYNGTKNYSVTGLDAGVYAWNCEACNNNNNCGMSVENWVFSVSAAPPPPAAVAIKRVFRCPLWEWFWCWEGRSWWEVFL